ncbi:MAG TPA: ABC transporter permease [Flavobacteriales bacterium]|nr:ABC transporter permease [Flavobacteriales bacterium]|tara:strand:+ start:65264 stop:66475 length:1212 start_codon:yes stop_codon:yes gene_type:complete
MKTIIKIAWRNIWRHKTRSLVIILAMALGLVSGIFILALNWGLSIERVNKAIATETSHIQIHHPKFREDFDPKYNFAIDTTIFTKNEKIKDFAPRSIVFGMVNSANSAAGVKINGVNFIKENKVTKFKDKLIEGALVYQYKRTLPVYISQATAEKLKVHIRSKIVVTFQDVNNQMVSAAFKVRGIFKTSNSMWDKGNIFVPITSLQQLLGTNNYQEIAVLLHNNDDLETVANELQNQLPTLKVETWKDIMPEMKMMVESFDQMMNIIIFIILLTLAFGLINTMLMAILERTREIGMLMAIGMNKKKIFTMIMTESLLLSLIGVPFGLLASWGIIEMFQKTGIDLSAYAKGMEEWGFDTVVYPQMEPEFYTQITVQVVVIMFLASVYPAYKALKLKPVDALRKI